MNEFQIAIAAGAFVAAVLSYKLPHAWLWIGLGTVSVIVCNVSFNYNFPYPAAFNLACDALMCLTISWLAKEKWEMGLYRIFQASVMVSIARMIVGADSEDTYRLALELCNWAALLMIAGTAILGGASGRDFLGSWRAYVRRAYVYLRRPPKTAHWRKVV